jgi:hypothetical protein
LDGQESQAFSKMLKTAQKLIEKMRMDIYWDSPPSFKVAILKPNLLINWWSE